MSFALVTRLLLLFLLRDGAATTGFVSGSAAHLGGGRPEKRSLLTFPPDSILQITMGITLAEKLERNNGAIVLAFQQNTPLPEEAQPLLSPSLVVSGRKFSIYDHLRDVIASYGFDGGQCLRKMICQIGETPLAGGVLEDVITFLLTPSKHRDLRGAAAEEEWDSLMASEKLGRIGGNCTSAFPRCTWTPLEVVSSFIRV